MRAPRDGSLGERVRAKVDALRQSPEFANYLLARERILELLENDRAREGGPPEPSLYWREELAGLEYMLDASPLVVERLRHHSYHLTGLRPYDYRSNRDAQQQMVLDKLTALRELGSEPLEVPESPALGGFGFEIDGGLYNVDTLKFTECSLALERSGVLQTLREAPARPVVWEVGGGWGGYAYTFKTLIPRCTYVITDLPEVLLFSATYLMTVFPHAELRFHGTRHDGDALSSPEGADFVFASNGALADTRPPRLDLALNMVSFQEMTSAQVRAYCEHAHGLGCRYLYSLNRDRSHYNRELSSVSAIIGERYETREVPILPVSYPERLTPKKIARGPQPDRYRHLVGWRPGQAPPPGLLEYES